MHEDSEGLYPANHAGATQRSRSHRSPSQPTLTDVQVLTPTLLERWAVRRRLPHLRPAWTGVRLARWSGAHERSRVVVCGVAGALAPSIHPGCVLVPEWVGRPDGTILRCDAGLVHALLDGAAALGYEPETGPLLTAPTLVTGPERETWARRGYVAADMETGLLAGHGFGAVATVRVILDGAQSSISDQWLTPLRALVQPGAWRELWWLCRVAPAYSLRAADVLKAAFDALPDGSGNDRRGTHEGGHHG